MTIDRIRELLAAIAADDDGTRSASLLDAALPLLRRWTDPTPITPEALERAGWVQDQEAMGLEWSFHWFGGDSRWFCHMVLHESPEVFADPFGDGGGYNVGPVPVRTIGQLNMIVDAIEGVR